MTIKSKAFKWEDYWAEAIYRKRFQNKDYLFAYIRRKHSYDDVKMDGEGSWVGLIEKPIHKMTVDKDEDSPTYGERVPETNAVHYQDGRIEQLPILKGTKFEYIYEANKKNIENFKKLYDNTIHGTTQLIWVLTSKNYSCEYPDDFWVSALKDVEDSIRKKRSIRSGNLPSEKQD